MNGEDERLRAERIERVKAHPTPDTHYRGDVIAQDFDEMDRDSFFIAASDPNALPDQMDFHLVSKHGEPDLAFSEEGFEAIGYQMHDWLMARTLAYYGRHGRFPVGLKATIKIDWDEAPTAESLQRDSDDPWWIAEDVGKTKIAVDGTHRLSQFLTERRAQIEKEKKKS